MRSGESAGERGERADGVEVTAANVVRATHTSRESAATLVLMRTTPLPLFMRSGRGDGGESRGEVHVDVHHVAPAPREAGDGRTSRRQRGDGHRRRVTPRTLPRAFGEVDVDAYRVVATPLALDAKRARRRWRARGEVMWMRITSLLLHARKGDRRMSRRRRGDGHPPVRANAHFRRACGEVDVDAHHAVPSSFEAGRRDGGDRRARRCGSASMSRRRVWP
mgnify:CR=1 FL=1